MPFIKGQSGNPSGRGKGSVSVQNRQAAEKARELGVDPFIILLHFASNNWQELGYESAKAIDPELRVSAAKDACKYIIPQLKAVEHSSGDGTTIHIPYIIHPDTQIIQQTMDSLGTADGQSDD